MLGCRGAAPASRRFSIHHVIEVLMAKLFGRNTTKSTLQIALKPTSPFMNKAELMP